jgi:predicted nuclease of predicted toxin-antitoxin system
LLDRFGAPPKIIWLTCGNTSNERLKQIFTTHLSAALEILAKGDNFVEIY